MSWIQQEQEMPSWVASLQVSPNYTDSEPKITGPVLQDY